MRSYREPVSIWGVLHDLHPLTRVQDCGYSLGKVVVVVDKDISIVVRNGHMVVLIPVADCSALLVRRVVAQGGGC